MPPRDAEQQRLSMRKAQEYADLAESNAKAALHNANMAAYYGGESVPEQKPPISKVYSANASFRPHGRSRTPRRSAYIHSCGRHPSQSPISNTKCSSTGGCRGRSKSRARLAGKPPVKPIRYKKSRSRCRSGCQSRSRHRSRSRRRGHGHGSCPIHVSSSTQAVSYCKKCKRFY